MENVKQNNFVTEDKFYTSRETVKASYFMVTQVGGSVELFEPNYDRKLIYLHNMGKNICHVS